MDEAVCDVDGAHAPVITPVWFRFRCNTVPFLISAIFVSADPGKSRQDGDHMTARTGQLHRCGTVAMVTHIRYLNRFWSPESKRNTMRNKQYR